MKVGSPQQKMHHFFFLFFCFWRTHNFNGAYDTSGVMSVLITLVWQFCPNFSLFLPVVAKQAGNKSSNSKNLSSPRIPCTCNSHFSRLEELIYELNKQIYKWHECEDLFVNYTLKYFLLIFRYICNVKLTRFFKKNLKKKHATGHKQWEKIASSPRYGFRMTKASPTILR